MNTRIGKLGNSLAVCLPCAHAKELDLKEGMEMEVSLVKGGILLRARRYTLDELVAGISPENTHGETDWGQAVGRESLWQTESIRSRRVLGLPASHGFADTLFIRELSTVCQSHYAERTRDNAPGGQFRQRR
jgi:antitoxin MazE